VLLFEWLAAGKVAMGALAKDDFDLYRTELKPAELRILHASRRIPFGLVLMRPTVERNQQQLIQQAMNEATPAIAPEVGYVPSAAPPGYKALISLIDKVKPIEARIQQKPASLYQSGQR